MNSSYKLSLELREALSALAIISVLLVSFGFYSGVAQAVAPVRKFSASTTPTTVNAGATESFTVTFTNSASSTDQIKSGHVTLPSGFTFLNSPAPFLSGVTNWSICSSGQEIQFGQDAGATDVNPGDSFSITFTAAVSATTTPGSYTISAQAFKNSSCNPGGGAEFDANLTPITVTVEPSTTGTLHVVKVVNNDAGGSATADDFSFQLNGATTTQFEADGQNDLTLEAGTYSVTEPEENTNNYVTTYDNCSEISLAAGGEATCTITNTFTPPTPDHATLTIVKNTLGGDGTFSFELTGANSTSTSITTSGGTGSVTLQIASGTSNVNELSQAGWDFTSASCQYDNQSVGTPIAHGEQITVDNGDSVTCTFTNTKTVEPQTGTLTVVKFVNNDAGGSATSSDFSIHVLTGDSDVAGSPQPGSAQGTSYTLLVGNYLVTESGGPSNYSATFTGDCDANGNVSVQNDSTATCTITNTFASSTSGGGGSSQPQCSDGIDNDNDGKIDFPADSGCSSPSDNSELNAGGSGGGGGATTPFTGGGGLVLGTSTEACPEYLHEYIKFGAQNNPSEVEKLQAFLNNFEANSLAVNGIYDNPTHSAVYAFQTKYLGDIMIPWGATKASGYVYYTTKKKINEIYCNFTREFPLTAQQEAEIARVKALGAAWQPAGSENQGGNAAPSGVQLPSNSNGNPEVGGASTGAQQSAAVSNASTTSSGGSWWSKFWNWLFGK
jgi:hypothetical protein